MYYTKNNLGKYRQKLIDMGITDEDKMVELMNFLRQLADIQIEAEMKGLQENEDNKY